MKDDILHSLWLLGKSLKALLLFDFAAARDGFFLILTLLFFKHKEIENYGD